MNRIVVCRRFGKHLFLFRKICQELKLIAKSKGNQTPVRDATIIKLALGTGLHVSELSKLKVEHLYLKKDQNSLLVKKGKGNKDRVVVFNAKLKNQIQEYMDYRNSNSPYLFPSERGEQMTTSAIQKVFKKMAKKAGLSGRYSIHALRHTHGTELYKDSGYNLRRFSQKDPWSRLKLSTINDKTSSIYLILIVECTNPHGKLQYL